MRSIGNIGRSPVPLPNAALGPAASSGALSSSAAGFQRISSGASAGTTLGRGSAGLGLTSLSAQTTSALLQEQDVDLLESQAGGHGGGGHGGMKMARNLEAENATGAEETWQTQKRKKLLRPSELKKTKESDESKDDDQDEEDDHRPQYSEPDEKSMRDWSWL